MVLTCSVWDEGIVNPEESPTPPDSLRPNTFPSLSLLSSLWRLTPTYWSLTWKGGTSLLPCLQHIFFPKIVGTLLKKTPSLSSSDKNLRVPTRCRRHKFQRLYKEGETTTPVRSRLPILGFPNALHPRGQQVPRKRLPDLMAYLRFPVSSIDPFPYGYNHAV